MKKFKFIIGAVFGGLLPVTVFAHEAYVMPAQDFWQEMEKPFNPHSIEALQNVNNQHITLAVVTGVLILLLLNFLFRRLKWGQVLTEKLESFSAYGPVFVRLAIAVSFFFSAKSFVFLGPELSLAQLPWSTILQWGLYLCSFLILLGIFTELAAIVALAIFSIGLFNFGPYVFTYLNYLGEIIVLMLFGTRHWSVDEWLLGPKKWFKKWKKYETTIIRICYGLALIYAGITVKFLHPDLTTQVATDWNLMQFNWLFPSDPLLITLGAGLAEIAVGLFILLGFELRLTVIISLFYMTLSLLFFRELVWPHLLLYGISLNLLVQPENFTLDHIFFRSKKRK